MEKVAIISAVRTPIGRYMGGLRDIPAYDLGALVLNEVVKRAKVVPASVDEVMMGQCYQSGEYVNIARMSLLCAGWPVEVTGITLDRRCCSGLDAICFGGMKIETGNADVIVAGGVEHMSGAEFYLPGSIKWGIGGAGDMPRGHGSLATWGIPLYDRIQRGRVMSQPIERFGVLQSMMVWGDGAAEAENVSRQECDEWSLRAHQKACAAIESGKFKEEIVPVTVPQTRGEPVVIDTDETPRGDTAIEKLAKLRSVLGGVSTAGNSSSENDGAAAVVLTTESKAKELGVEPIAYLKSFAVAGADPVRTWLAVPVAVNKALEKAGLNIGQVDLIEIQEAFAGQLLADVRELGMSAEDCEKRVNVNGSGISLGHPVGATGAMRMTTLLHEMKRRNVRYGLETICGGGGLGIAAVLERNV
ncbi:acetyl-CoA C-acyltransferase [Chloroflexota bacterium]